MKLHASTFYQEWKYYLYIFSHLSKSELPVDTESLLNTYKSFTTSGLTRGCYIITHGQICKMKHHI